MLKVQLTGHGCRLSIVIICSLAQNSACLLIIFTVSLSTNSLLLKICDCFDSVLNLSETNGSFNQGVVLPHELRLMGHHDVEDIIMVQCVDGMLILFQEKVFRKGSPLA